MSSLFQRFHDFAEDDVKLLEAVRLRDQCAMITIFDRYASVIYSVALGILKDTEAAEDVMQDVLCQVWTGSRTTPANGAPFGAWLVCVTRSRAIDVLGKRRPISDSTSSFHH
jgi:RNA polymerase sigma-70 factor (ECF subfamily)